MSTHTPGPWEVSTDDDRCYEVEGPTQTDGFRGGYRWFTEADARLIAAAPDLLDACKGILAGFESGVFCRSIDGDAEAGWAMKLIGPIRALAVAQQAIAKAEGQP